MPAASKPRRAPTGGERVRDAERTKARLLEAALDEFAACGYAGARVSSIADRAGVNKQLISYYFGGKQGLHRDLLLSWEQSERELRAPGRTLSDIALGYLRRALRDPRGTRLAMWRALTERPLTDGPTPNTPETSGNATDAEATDSERERDTVRREQDDLRASQRTGELSSELDLASTQLAITGMVIAPIVLPDLVAALFDEPVDSAEFEHRYSETLTKIIQRLRDIPAETT